MHKDPIESLFAGAKQIKLPSCHSTNLVASALLADTNPREGTIVITHHQTAGKGQRGNSWESEPGKNLTFSIILKPGFLPVSRQFELTVASSVAIIKSLHELGLPEARIKWPNDIFYGNAKIAGILIENTVRADKMEHAILGIGLNVNQVDFQVDGATSVRNELRQELLLDQMLDLLLKRISKYYSLLRSGKFQYLRDLYTENLMWLDQQRTFKDLLSDTVYTGKIIEVNNQGQLIIRTQAKDFAYDFKQIAFLK